MLPLADYVEAIREVERDAARPIGILADLQGPKLRIGALAGGEVTLETGATVQFTLDQGPVSTLMSASPGSVRSPRAGQSAPGRRRTCAFADHRGWPESAVARVELGGHLTDRKGVNALGVVLPLAALSAKDRADLDRALELQVDWIALSFVQRPEDAARAADCSRTCWGPGELESPRPSTSLRLSSRRMR